ncbi:MAG: CHAT domain-containing protein [Bacteroidia bacterium]|nr:CHAT domain-containing protein [Bacteroidia bacterium]
MKIKHLLLTFMLACQAGFVFTQNITAHQAMKLADSMADTSNYDHAFNWYNYAAEKYLKEDSCRKYAEAIVGTAICLTEMDQTEPAIQTWTEIGAFITHEWGENDVLMANVHDGLGWPILNIPDFQGAYEHFSKALEIRRQYWGDDHPETGESYSYLGHLFLFSGNFSQSEQAFKKSLENRVKNPDYDPAKLADSYNNLGYFYFQIHKNGLAIQNLKEAVKIYKKIVSPNHGFFIRTYANLGTFNHYQGNLELGETYCKQSVRIALNQKVKQPDFIGIGFANLGRIYKEKGNFNKSLYYFQMAFEIFKHTRSKNLAGITNNLTTIYLDKNDLYKALEYGKQSLEYCQQYGNFSGPVGEILFHNNLGSCYIKLNMNEKAEEEFMKAIDLSEKFFPGPDPKLGISYGLLASVYAKMKRNDLAMENYEKAKSIFEATNDNEYLTNFLLSLAEQYKKNADFENAEKYCRLAIQKRAEFSGPNHPQVRMGLYNLARTFQNQRKFDLAVNTYREALQKFNPLFSENKTGDLCQPSQEHYLYSEIHSHLALALLKRWKENPTQPSDLKEAMISVNIAANTFDSLRLGYSIKARESASAQASLTYETGVEVCLELFKQTQDSSYLTQAFRLSERGKSSLLYLSLQESGAMQFGDVPHELVKSIEELHNTISYYETSHYNEFAKGQAADPEKLSMWEDIIFNLKIKRDKLQENIQANFPHYNHLINDLQIAEIPEIQNAIPDSGTTILQYFSGDSTLTLFTLSKTSFQTYQIPFDSTFKAQTLNFIQDLSSASLASEQGNTAKIREEFTQNAHFLYQKLIAPAFPNPDGLPQKLVIIPDGVLGYLPFELLQTAPAGAGADYAAMPYLLDKSAIRYAWSSTLFVEDSHKENRPARALKPFIGFAPSYLPGDSGAVPIEMRELYAESRAGFAPLVHNQPELKAILDQIPGEGYFGENSSKANILAALPDYRILHFAMHGVTNDSLPEFSALIPAISNEEGAEGYLFAKDIYNTQINADLAVLSACNTGNGRLIRGEGIMSMARAFRYAGCPNLVMSLWQVNDESTREIMELFYRNLKHKMGKDEALRQAKLAYLKDHPRSHPHFWAAFQLIGDDAPVVLPNPAGRLRLLGAVFLPLILVSLFGIRKRGGN